MYGFQTISYPKTWKPNNYDETSKPKSKTAKGNDNQKKTEKWIKEQGFTFITARRHAYTPGRSMAIDYFGLWDHICVAKNNATLKLEEFTQGKEGREITIDVKKGETVYIQTKSNKRPGALELKDHFNFPADYKLLVVWADKARHPKAYYLNGAIIEQRSRKTDGRKDIFTID